jgi:hypothetical protein
LTFHSGFTKTVLSSTVHMLFGSTQKSVGIETRIPSMLRNKPVNQAHIPSIVRACPFSKGCVRRTAAGKSFHFTAFEVERKTTYLLSCCAYMGNRISLKKKRKSTISIGNPISQRIGRKSSISIGNPISLEIQFPPFLSARRALKTG